MYRNFTNNNQTLWPFCVRKLLAISSCLPCYWFALFFLTQKQQRRNLVQVHPTEQPQQLDQHAGRFQTIYDRRHPHHGQSQDMGQGQLPNEPRVPNVGMPVNPEPQAGPSSGDKATNQPEDTPVSINFMHNSIKKIFWEHCFTTTSAIHLFLFTYANVMKLDSFKLIT